METDGFIISKFNNNFVSDIHIVVDEIIKIDVYKIIKKMKLNTDIYIPCTLTFKKYSEIVASKFSRFNDEKEKTEAFVFTLMYVKSEIVSQSYINFTNEKKKEEKKENVARKSDVNRWILDPSPHKTDGTALTSITLRNRRAENRTRYRPSDLINPLPTSISLSQTLTRV